MNLSVYCALFDMRNKLLYFTAFCMLLSARSIGQTTAVDFATNDCSGVSHHLFSELDGGKIVVAVFVMPCVGCIIPSHDAQTVVESYVSTYPGRVEMYLIDDDALTTCASLNSWRNSNGLHLMPTFSDSAVIMAEYGSPAMPKIVVLGGTDHHIYGIQDNVLDMELLRSNINAALGIPTAVTAPRAGNPGFGVFPNPANGGTVVSLTAKVQAEYKLLLTDRTGRIVKTTYLDVHKGENKFVLSLAGIEPGIYTISVGNGTLREETKLLVK